MKVFTLLLLVAGAAAVSKKLEVADEALVDSLRLPEPAEVQAGVPYVSATSYPDDGIATVQTFGRICSKRRPCPPKPAPGPNKPAKPLYLYAWCGLAPESNSTNTNDYVATIDATPGSPKFGQIIHVADSPYSYTEAHHCGVDKAGKWFGAGGLTAFLAKEKDGSPIPDALLFDISNPAAPKYSHGVHTSGGACTDEFRSTRDGGFAVTNMCGRSGSYGGGWFEIKPDMKTVIEHNIADQKVSAWQKKSANPHGIDIDEDNDRVVTSDFIDVVSTLITPENPNPVPIVQTTIRVWQYSTGKLLKTFDVGRSRGNGMMDCRRMPNKGSNQALFTVSDGLGGLWLVDALKLTPPRRVYCFVKTPGNLCKALPGTCIQGNPFKNGTRMAVVSYGLDQVRLVDISDPYNPTDLDIYQMPKGAGGHVVKYDEETGILAVSTYFLDIPGTVLRYNADQKVSLFYVDLKTDKLILLGAIDFTYALDSKGPSSCHGLAFNTYYEY